MSDWLDGFIDHDDDLDQVADADDTDDPPPAAGPILACRHCGSPRLTLKSTSTDSIAVRFACAACGRHTTHHLPYGYQRVYCAVL